MALVCFETRLSKIIFNGRLHEAVSPETVLAAEITKTVKDELKRSVSCIFYCVRARRSTNFAIPATATPSY